MDGQTLLRAEVEGARQVETLVGWGTDPRTLYVARAPRAFGLTISPPLLLRTDQVIE